MQGITVGMIIAQAQQRAVLAGMQPGQPFPPDHGIYDPVTDGPETVSWFAVVLTGNAVGQGNRMAALPAADDPIMRNAGLTFEELVPRIRNLLHIGAVVFQEGELHANQLYFSAGFQERLMREMEVQGLIAPVEAWIHRLVCAAARRYAAPPAAGANARRENDREFKCGFMRRALVVS